MPYNVICQLISIVKINKTKKAFIIRIHEFWIDRQTGNTAIHLLFLSLFMIYLLLYTCLILNFVYKLTFLGVFPCISFLSSSPIRDFCFQIPML